jgi:hypothetical protein
MVGELYIVNIIILATELAPKHDRVHGCKVVTCGDTWKVVGSWFTIVVATQYSDIVVVGWFTTVPTSYGTAGTGLS